MLDRLLQNVRGGQSAVLVIRGEAGVGKTALLRYAAEQASGFRLGQIAGVESVDEGNHFAAWQEPDLFTTEVRAAFRPLRTENGGRHE